MRSSWKAASVSAFATIAMLGACDARDATPVSPSNPPVPVGAESDVATIWSDWSTPTNLGSVVNSAANDQHPGISRDGLSLYFSSDRAGGFGDFDLYVSQRSTVDDDWGPPQNVGATVNSSARDLSPTLSYDGHRMFFHSGRPGGCGGFDLYVTTRENVHDDFAWGPPINLGCTVNSSANDAGPTYTEEDGGPVLYFTSTRAGGFGDFDIYKSYEQTDGSWGPAIHVPELSGAFRDTRTAVSRTGRELFLSSDATGRTNGIGGQDLWVSTRSSRGDPWSTPTNLGPIVNTASFDGAPALSFDGSVLYFYSDRPGGRGAADLYCATRTRWGSGRPVPHC